MGLCAEGCCERPLQIKFPNNLGVFSIHSFQDFDPHLKWTGEYQIGQETWRQKNTFNRSIRQLRRRSRKHNDPHFYENHTKSIILSVITFVPFPFDQIPFVLAETITFSVQRSVAMNKHYLTAHCFSKYQTKPQAELMMMNKAQTETLKHLKMAIHSGMRRALGAMMHSLSKKAGNMYSISSVP